MTDIEFDVTPTAPASGKLVLRIDLAAGSQLWFEATTGCPGRWRLVAPSGTQSPVEAADAHALIVARAGNIMLEGYAIGRRVRFTSPASGVLRTGTVVGERVGELHVELDECKEGSSLRKGKTRRWMSRSACEFMD